MRQQRIVVVSPGYNCKRFLLDWYKGINQNYDNFEILAIDDCSIDGTSELLDVLADQNKRIKVVHNNRRRYGVYNKTKTLKENIALSDDDIIVTLDLDDFFVHENVLLKINEIFTDKIWFSYGNIYQYPRLSQEINWNEKVRIQPWKIMPPRCVRWFLHKNILKVDLQDNGEWYKFPKDRITCYPVIEMAGPDHIHCNKEVFYYYHIDNPICDMYVNNKVALETLAKIQRMPSYVLKTKEELINHVNDW